MFFFDGGDYGWLFFIGCLVFGKGLKNVSIKGFRKFLIKECVKFGLI